MYIYKCTIMSIIKRSHLIHRCVPNNRPAMAGPEVVISMGKKITMVDLTQYSHIFIHHIMI